MISVKNEKTIQILNDLLFSRKIEGSAIRSIEIVRVNSGGSVEVKVINKAGKIMTNLIHDMDLLLKSEHIKSYSVSHTSDMVAVFEVVMNKE